MVCTLSNLLYGIGLTPGASAGKVEAGTHKDGYPVHQEIDLTVKPGARALG